MFKLPTKYALTKELWIVVTIKAVLIFLIWWAFFSHPAVERMNESTVIGHFYQNVTVGTKD